MNLQPLGSTALTVSPLGLGLAAVGRPGYINLGHSRDLGGDTDISSMQDRAHALLDAAWGEGIRYFDVARSYGRAEDFLASWLGARSVPTEGVTVGSKWGYTYTAGWKVKVDVHEVKEHSLPVLRRQWTESRTRLGQYLKLYQIHSATLASGVLENGAVLDELARLRAGGRRIGLSVSGPEQTETLRRALEITRDGVRLFDTVQATWNLLEPSAGPALREVRGEGVGVIVKEALANGRLTHRNREPEFASQRIVLEQLAERLGTTLDRLALAAALAQPWADTVLSGATTVEQLRSNIAALDLPWDEETAAELTAVTEPAEAYWQTRSELAWN